MVKVHKPCSRADTAEVPDNRVLGLAGSTCHLPLHNLLSALLFIIFPTEYHVDGLVMPAFACLVLNMAAYALASPRLCTVASARHSAVTYMHLLTRYNSYCSLLWAQSGFCYHSECGRQKDALEPNSTWRPHLQLCLIRRIFCDCWRCCYHAELLQVQHRVHHVQDLKVTIQPELVSNRVSTVRQVLFAQTYQQLTHQQ